MTAPRQGGLCFLLRGERLSEGFGVVRKYLFGLLAAALLLAACGGGDGGSDAASTTTGPDDATTTTLASTTTDAPVTTVDDDDEGGPRVGLADIPQECLDAFSDFLRDIEPLVEDVDWSSASLATFEEVAISLEPATVQYEEALEGTQCDELEVDTTDEESFEYLISIAKDRAPGTVGYFEMIRDIVGVGGSSADASGDCETDIASLQAIIDQGGTMEDLTLVDITNIGNLATSITSSCSPERAAEFFSQPDFTDFMGG